MRNKAAGQNGPGSLAGGLILSKAQLRNQFRLNELWGKNAGKGQGRRLLLLASFAMLAVMVAVYAYLLAWGMLKVGLARAVPGYALTAASLMTLFFTILKSNGFLFAFVIFDMVKDTDIFQVQRFLNNLVSVYAVCAIGVGRLDIGAVIAFSFEIPLRSEIGIMNLDVPLAISRGSEQFKDELLNKFRRYPCCTEPDRNFTCRQVNRLNSLKAFDMTGIFIGIHLRHLISKKKLFAHIA